MMYIGREAGWEVRNLRSIIMNRSGECEGPKGGGLI
jgi:hypothetical protein